jgi:hypothetical protein
MPKLYGIGARTGRLVHFVRLLGIMLLTSLGPGCTVQYQDSNVQAFAAGEAAILDGKQLYLTRERARFDNVLAAGEKITAPWGEPPYYYRAVTEQSDFLVNPTDHETIDFTVSDPFLVPGTVNDMPEPWNFFDLPVYVGSDGTIAFGEPGAGNATLGDHFSTQQVSLLPLDASLEGARVSYALLSNMLVITYENAGGNSVQFIMAELYERPEMPGLGRLEWDDIVITYREVSESVRPGVVGISWINLGGFSSEYVIDFLSGFEEGAGGQANLVESTDTTTGGRVILPLP